MPPLLEDEPSKTTPLRVEKLEERLLGKVGWLKLVKSEQLRCYAPEYFRILEVQGCEGATVVELLDPVLLVVMQALRCNALLTEQQKDFSLCGKVKDGILFPLKSSVQHSGRVHIP